MSVIIVQNKSIPRENKKKKRTGEDIHREFATQNKHMSQTKAKELGMAEEFSLPNEEFIIVGDTTGNGNVKAKIFSKVEQPKIGFVYDEKGKRLLDLPKSISNVGSFVEEVRIYSSEGIVNYSVIELPSMEIQLLG